LNLFWQKLKILTFPFDSFYSFRNPDQKLNEYDSMVLFQEVRNSDERLDRITLLKNSIYNTKEKEEWILKKYDEISDYFFSLRDNRICIPENEEEEYCPFFNLFTEKSKPIKKYLWYHLNRLITDDLLKISYIARNYSLKGQNEILLGQVNATQAK